VTDIVDAETRSRMMAAIRGRNTKPELVVRRFLHRCGLRFRVHSRTLPGRPDIALPKYKAIVNVHGCFWHRHSGCRYAYMPKTRLEFWTEKLRRNVERDGENDARLQNMGWNVLTIWECEVRDESLLRRLVTAIRSRTT
jgi:DNA mismatch endonuclease, patch repair protein